MTCIICTDWLQLRWLPCVRYADFRLLLSYWGLFRAILWPDRSFTISKRFDSLYLCYTAISDGAPESRNVPSSSTRGAASTWHCFSSQVCQCCTTSTSCRFASLSERHASHRRTCGVCWMHWRIWSTGWIAWCRVTKVILLCWFGWVFKDQQSDIQSGMKFDSEHCDRKRLNKL